MPDLRVTSIVETFTREIADALEASAVARIQAVLAGAFGLPQRRGSGRPPRQAVAPAAPVAARPATGKKQPRQLSRMPWFESPAEPSMGLTCIDFGAKKNLKKATPKVARARKLQGKYLGSLKSLKGADRAKVKRIAKEKGVAAGLKFALSLKAPGRPSQSRRR